MKIEFLMWIQDSKSSIPNPLFAMVELKILKTDDEEPIPELVLSVIIISLKRIPSDQPLERK